MRDQQVLLTAPVELTSVTALRLSAALAQACAGVPRRVIIDFAGTRCCDTAALQDLLDLATDLRQQGCQVEIRSSHASLRDIAGVLAPAVDQDGPD